MFKNKFLILFVVVIVGIIVFYSLNTSKPYADQINDKRKEYISNLISMEESPIKSIKDTSKIAYFEANPSFKVISNFTAFDSGKTFKIQMTDSTFLEIKSAGKAKFKLNDKEFEVIIFDEEDHFLLPFRDETNGRQTYGGGRYINIPKSNLLNDELEIDFNDAHNFYCAYSEKFVCPIPPKENALQFPITAGEMNFK
jgi:uncharacterized protein (DUF1684 family)